MLSPNQAQSSSALLHPSVEGNWTPSSAQPTRCHSLTERCTTAQASMQRDTPLPASPSPEVPSYLLSSSAISSAQLSQGSTNHRHGPLSSQRPISSYKSQSRGEGTSGVNQRISSLSPKRIYSDNSPRLEGQVLLPPSKWKPPNPEHISEFSAFEQEHYRLKPQSDWAFNHRDCGAMLPNVSLVFL